MLPDEETKLCPFCREIIKASAIKCRFCGEWLETSTTSADPITAVRRALAARYKIIYQLGHGGMSVLYRASEISSGRDVALKVLPLHLSNEREYVGRFHREASALSKLDHPNIIKIFDEGVENSVHFMSMEFLEGRDLHKLLMARGPLSPEETAKIIAPVARALDYAHRNTLVHRDVKSSNIFITREGKPVLTDFGIAHISTDSQLTVTGTVIGTPEFMSPEQAEGKPVDGRTDIYSLGVVMYNALTGRFPYHGDSPLTTIYKIINEKHTPVKELKTLPDWMEFAIEACLEKDPDRRITSGHELSDILTKRSIPEGEKRKELDLETLRLSKEDMDQVLGQALLKGPGKDAFVPASPDLDDETELDSDGTSAYNDEEPRKKRLIIPAFIAAAIIVLATVLVYTAYISPPEKPAGSTQVEKTSMRTPEAADGKGGVLKPEIETPQNAAQLKEPSGNSAAENAASDNTGSSPNAGVNAGRRSPQLQGRTQMAQGTPVQKTTVGVPDLEGMSLQEASRALRRLGLRSGAVTRITSTAQNYNLVIKQIPKPGRRIEEGSAVNLIVGE